MWSSTCFGRHTAHHEEPKIALAASGFSYVEGCKTFSGTVYCAWQRPPTTRPTTFHVWKTRGCQCSFRLLVMGGVSPETCWASYKYGIIKFWYILASCWIFLYESYYDARIHEHHGRTIFQRNSDTSFWTGYVWLRIQTTDWTVNMVINRCVPQNARHFLTEHVNHYLPNKDSAACKELHSDSVTSAGRLAVNSETITRTSSCPEKPDSSQFAQGRLHFLTGFFRSRNFHSWMVHVTSWFGHWCLASFRLSLARLLSARHNFRAVIQTKPALSS